MTFQNTRANSSASVGLAAHHLQNLRRRDFLAGEALVDGQWVTGRERDTVIDPATGEEIADVTRCGAAEMEVAITAAERSFPAWRGLLPVRRAAVLRSWASLMLEHEEELAVLVTSEQGKPLAEARQEIAYGAGFLDWFAAEGSEHTERLSRVIRVEVSCKCECSR